MFINSRANKDLSLSFILPSLDEMERLEAAERMNIFRRYFASSRYNRLMIQQTLVRSAFVPEIYNNVSKLEKSQSDEFLDVMSALLSSKYFSEFVSAAKEEDSALQKIIEAYDERMSKGGILKKE